MMRMVTKLNNLISIFGPILNTLSILGSIKFYVAKLSGKVVMK